MGTRHSLTISLPSTPHTHSSRFWFSFLASFFFVPLRSAAMDEEMTDLLLLKKVCIPELEVYKKAPWELVVSSSYHPTGVLYCFARVPRSIARDNRLKRKTRGGTWVANGIPHRDRKAAIVKDPADDGDSLAAKAPPFGG
ncbi:hypothetical protein B296_00022823 [Ensete ventricosum]|uniref:NAC domain-containing protein n=1 Tax=Ensete ventricosum TaxID=4639 RepID=A0A426ZFI5_ENSVE|nr:hypothetical protein B296_00022823 [Ensete ventricosum]